MDNYDDLMQQLSFLNRQPNWGAPNSLGLFDNSFAGEQNMMGQNFYYPQINRGGMGQANQGGSMIDQMNNMGQIPYYPQYNQGGSMIDQVSQNQQPPQQQPMSSGTPSMEQLMSQSGGGQPAPQTPAYGQVPKAEQIGQQPEPRYAAPAVDSNPNNIRARKKALNDPNAPEDNPYAVGLR